MILKGSQRSGAKALARHLLNDQENDHVEVHAVKGFCTHDLTEALKEIQAIAKGTRAKQPIFSVALNPPLDAEVDNQTFEDVVERIADATGLSGQPYVMVFHEKDGRRHAHVAFSRINAETMTAINLDFTKQRLRKLSQALFVEHGWTLPRGMIDGAPKSVLTYSLAEWQEAKRHGVHAGDQKALIQQCWAASDNAAAFAQALAERGYRLAKGERRGHVIVAPHGQVLAVARCVGQRAKVVAERLGPTEDYRDVATVRAEIKREMGRAFARLANDARGDLSRKRQRLEKRKANMVARHRVERAQVDDGQAARWEAEADARKAAFKTGLSGMWQWLTGEHARLQRKHWLEVKEALTRDEEQRHAHRWAQLRERRALEEARIAARQEAFGLVKQMKAEFVEMFKGDGGKSAPGTRKQKRRPQRNPRRQSQPSQAPQPQLGPEVVDKVASRRSRSQPIMLRCSP